MAEQLDKMDMLVRLSAIGLINGRKQKDQIRLLSIAGMGPAQIAELIGTTPNTVNVVLSGLRRTKGLNLKPEGTEENG
jgi:tRNA A22 N-methylase